MRHFIVVTVTLVLLLAACGGGGTAAFTATTEAAATSTTSVALTTTTTGEPPTTTPTTEPQTTTVPTLRSVWSRVPDDEAVFAGSGYQEMNGVVAGGPGLVAVGSSRSGDGWDAAVWTSVDGLVWTRVPYDEAVFAGPGNQEMRAVAAGGPGLVAVGHGGPGASWWDAAVWTSVDGLAWTRVPHDEAVFGGPELEDRDMYGVAVGGPGLVAVGAESSGGTWDAAVWVSADGLSWARVDLTSTPRNWCGAVQRLFAVVAGGPGLVAVGAKGFGRGWIGPDADLNALVCTSVDGLTWTRAPNNEAVFGGAYDQMMNAVATVGPGLVAVGYDMSGEGPRDAAVWLSADGLTWTRVPHDEAVFGGPGGPEMNGVVAGGPGLVAVGSETSGEGSVAAVWVSPPPA